MLVYSNDEDEHILTLMTRSTIMQYMHKGENFNNVMRCLISS